METIVLKEGSLSHEICLLQNFNLSHTKLSHMVSQKSFLGDWVLYRVLQNGPDPGPGPGPGGSGTGIGTKIFFVTGTGTGPGPKFYSLPGPGRD
jgi:hypothetical protein